MLSELTLSNWEDRQENLDQAEIERRLAEAQASEAEAEKNRAEEERAKAEAEKLKAETERVKSDPPSSTASESGDNWKEVAELQAKRIDALAKLMSAESESRKAEWQEAQTVISDMKEALELNSDLISKLDQSTEDLMQATAALVKMAQEAKAKK